MKATKNDIERRDCSQKSDASHKNSSLYFYSVAQSFCFCSSWSFDNITTSNKKSTSKKEPTSESEIITSYLHKNIIIPLLWQWGLFIHTCVSINSIVSRDVIFYLLWYNAIWWSSHICKKSSFLSSFLSEV